MLCDAAQAAQGCFPHHVDEAEPCPSLLSALIDVGPAFPGGRDFGFLATTLLGDPSFAFSRVLAVDNEAGGTGLIQLKQAIASKVLRADGEAWWGEQLMSVIPRTPAAGAAATESAGTSARPRHFPTALAALLLLPRTSPRDALEAAWRLGDTPKLVALLRSSKSAGGGGEGSSISGGGSARAEKSRMEELVHSILRSEETGRDTSYAGQALRCGAGALAALLRAATQYAAALERQSGGGDDDEEEQQLDDASGDDSDEDEDDAIAWAPAAAGRGRRRRRSGRGGSGSGRPAKRSKPAPAPLDDASVWAALSESKQTFRLTAYGKELNLNVRSICS